MAEEILNQNPEVVVAPKRNKHEGSLKRRKIIGNVSIYTVLVLICFIWMIPFVCILVQSFNVDWLVASQAQLEAGTIAELPRGGGVVGYFWPANWGFTNYINLFTKSNFFIVKGSDGSIKPGWYLNTLFISAVTAVIQTIMVLTMSYTLSRLRFKGRKFLMNFMLVLGMFPGFLTMIVLYFLLKTIHCTQSGTAWGLILVYTASSGMGYYVSKGFFDTVPKSLDEAARIDGATRLQVMTKVILPLSKPIIIYTVLTAFMGPWGDFMFARVMSFGEDTSYNVAVGLQQFLVQDQIGQSYTLFCAGGVLVAIPITILFMFLQRYYVEGVTGGAVKG